jgi:hypothetical protein
MLSKCANPECSEIFLHLHEGKIFYLAPTPDVQIAMGMQHPALHERFWLCARCAKEMTLTWVGTQVAVVRVPVTVAEVPPASVPKNEIRRRRPRTRAATAGREDT